MWSPLYISGRELRGASISLSARKFRFRLFSLSLLLYITQIVRVDGAKGRRNTSTVLLHCIAGKESSFSPIPPPPPPKCCPFLLISYPSFSECLNKQCISLFADCA